MTSITPIGSPNSQTPRVGEVSVGYRETTPEGERRPHRITIAAQSDVGHTVVNCLQSSTHAKWYAVTVASSAEEVVRLLMGDSAEVNLIDEWANDIIARLPMEQRQRIQRRSVLITNLEAPGIAALTCFASLPRSRLTRHSLDHVLWQAIRQAGGEGIKPTASAIFDVLRNLARLGLTESSDLATAMRPITEAGAEIIKADRVSIWRFEGTPKHLVCLDMFDRAPGTHISGMTNPASNIPVYSMALENHRILSMEDAQHDHRCAELLPYLQQSGIGALLDAPIYLDGKVVGLLCHAHFGAPRQWTEREQTIAANLADYAQILYMANQRQKAEDALRVNQQALAQAQKMEALGRLSSGIAHDFNNLLMVISGNAQMFERKIQRDAAPDPRHLRNIIDACERAESLARKLLTLGRRSAGSPQWLELNHVISEVSRLLGPGLGPTVAVQITPGAPAWVHVDSDELQSALINLATNARDAMPNGGELHLTMETVEPSQLPSELDSNLGPFTLVTVRDTGMGMPPEVQARAMEPFFTTKPADKGTGLGLWNVYNCMRSHHGTMTIASAPGEGTSVNLYLPTTAKPPAVLDASVAAKPGETRAGHILLVDDDVAVQRIIADMLGFLGHRVTVCSDGAAAVERFRAERNSIDLVLIDLGMPGMPGNECLRALRVIDISCRCLVMSGNINDQLANDCLRDGALGIVPKPFSLTACAQAVEKALATVRMG